MGVVRDLEGVRLVIRIMWTDFLGFMCILCEDIYVLYNRDIYCGRGF